MPDMPRLEGQPRPQKPGNPSVLKAVIWKLRQGCPCCDLQAACGKLNSVSQRFKTRRKLIIPANALVRDQGK